MIKKINHYLSELLAKYQFSKPGNSNDNHETFNGSYRVRKTVIPQSITINGEAILGDGVTIQKKIVVNGSLIAKNVLFESDLFANGTISITDSTIKGHVFPRGVLQSTNSIFLNTIQLMGDESHFYHCQTGTIFVQKTFSKKVVQNLYLSNGTSVSGDIIFQTGMGKIYIDSTSLIQGKIIGGELVHRP